MQRLWLGFLAMFVFPINLTVTISRLAVLLIIRTIVVLITLPVIIGLLDHPVNGLGLRRDNLLTALPVIIGLLAHRHDGLGPRCDDLRDLHRDVKTPGDWL